MAELGSMFEVRVTAELLAHVPVETQVVEEIIALEDAVVLHHPVVRIGHIGLEDCRGMLGMVRRRQLVADVMQEGANHVFLVAPVSMRARGRLQAVLEPVDRIASKIATKQLEVPQDAIGQPGHV